MEGLKSIAEIAEHFITSLGIIVAGLFAYYKFIRRREIRKDMNVEIMPRVFLYNAAKKQKIISVEVWLENTGTVDVRRVPGKNEYDCSIEIKKLPGNLPDNLRVDFDKLEYLVPPINYLEGWDKDTEYPDEPTIWEPGARDRETYKHVVTNYEGFVLIRANFADVDSIWWEDSVVCDLRMETIIKQQPVSLEQTVE